MKWHHIMDKQPENLQEIIQVDRPYKGHYAMGMRQYYQGCAFKEFLEFCNDNNIPNPDFWWIAAADFSFPDSKKVLNEYDDRPRKRFTDIAKEFLARRESWESNFNYELGVNIFAEYLDEFHSIDSQGNQE